MKYLAIFITAIFLFACGSSPKKNQTQENIEEKSGNLTLELIWQTDTVLLTPESVLADESEGVLYVSNMNLDMPENSGNGFISKLDLQGNIIELKWAEGLNSPKGMGIYGDYLFVADNSALVKIDIKSGEIAEKIPIEGNPGLNDVTVGDDGSVYTSGYNSNIIYKVTNGNVTTVFTGEPGENFNGLLWEPERMMLITSSGSTFKTIDWTTGDVTEIAKDLGHGDGIIPLGDNDYITSDWRGRVFYIPANGEPVTLLDTRDQEINAADIDYIADENLLLVPTFYDNRLNAYKIIIE
ncbi:MAG: hypothetical protein JXR61_06945 [Prolixibacteraceae bacterium]|nr:hypothetical protein [Prolixibacteraceae bacterium]